MKTKTFTVLVLVLLFCASCSKDGNIHPEKITGNWIWDTSYPHPIMDTGASYNFGEDLTFVKKVSGGEETPISFTIEGTYTIKHKVLSLYKGTDILEEYKILKVNSEYMELQHTDKEENPRLKRLLRK